METTKQGAFLTTDVWESVLIMKNVMATDELLRKYYENIMAFFSTLGALVVITV